MCQSMFLKVMMHPVLGLASMKSFFHNCHAFPGGPAAVPTLAPSPGPATVSPVYAPVPSINKRKEITPNDGQRDGKPPLNLNAGSSLNVKSASAVNDADPHKSSEAEAELSKPEMNANAHAPLPHPPGKSAPPPAGPPPSLPPKPPTPSPPPPPKVRPPNPPKPGNFPKSLPLRAHQRGCSSETRGSDSLDLMLLKQN
ncbi:hypothetical protein KY289_031241 [Solanum tuberosum]|nr:hypothetical protein KY289_031241 [Solanum tuberosum]